MQPSCKMPLLYGVILLCAVSSMLFGQETQAPALPGRLEPRFDVIPVKNAKSRLPEIMRQSLAGATIPLWSYSVVSGVDGKTYSGQMVGRNPFYHGLRTTTIQAYLVPVIVTFPSGAVFDPTRTDSCLGNIVKAVVVNSPIFKNVDFIMNGVDVGSTQYIDAFQRANFWSDISTATNGYHTLLGLKSLPAVKVTVPSGIGDNFPNGNCPYGQMDETWWDNYLQTTLIPSLSASGVGPTTFPIFYFDSVEMCTPFPTECKGSVGYHSGYTPSGLLQTYAVSDFDTSGRYGGDVSVLSHEVGEWMNDPVPTKTLNTPAWGHVGQYPTSCSPYGLEVGDPLTGSLLPPISLNGFTYHLQELAFFSWFYRIPSIGAGGVYSDNGTFTADAGAVCI